MALRLPFVGSLGTEPDAPGRGLRFVKRFAAILALATLVSAGGVGAAKASPFTPELEADYAFAEQWWGAMPTGCSTITREVLPDAAMPGAAGQATQPEPGAEPVLCVIQIAESSLLESCHRREIVLHEYGHLLGYGHSEDPANIMYGHPGSAHPLCRVERAALFLATERREVGRCRALHPGAHRKECWRGVREERRAYGELLASMG